MLDFGLTTAVARITRLEHLERSYLPFHTLSDRFRSNTRYTTDRPSWLAFYASGPFVDSYYRSLVDAAPWKDPLTGYSGDG